VPGRHASSNGRCGKVFFVIRMWEQSWELIVYTGIYARFIKVYCEEEVSHRGFEPLLPP
jgi:hypothetical protein